MLSITRVNSTITKVYFDKSDQRWWSIAYSCTSGKLKFNNHVALVTSCELSASRISFCWVILSSSRALKCTPGNWSGLIRGFTNLRKLQLLKIFWIAAFFQTTLSNLKTFWFVKKAKFSISWLVKNFSRLKLAKLLWWMEFLSLQTCPRRIQSRDRHSILPTVKITVTESSVEEFQELSG